MNWQEIKSMLKDIICLTTDNTITWRNGDTDGIYEIHLGSGIITIDRSYEPIDDNYNYYLAIYNADNISIFNQSTNPTDRQEQEILKTLYNTAEDSCLQRQATMQSIKTTLEQLKNSPF